MRTPLFERFVVELRKLGKVAPASRVTRYDVLLPVSDVWVCPGWVPTQLNSQPFRWSSNGHTQMAAAEKKLLKFVLILACLSFQWMIWCMPNQTVPHASWCPGLDYSIEQFIGEHSPQTQPRGDKFSTMNITKNSIQLHPSNFEPVFSQQCDTPPPPFQNCLASIKAVFGS